MIYTIDDLPPETIAMLQALYSRSPKSVHEHLANMKDASSFMSQYYVGYGHKSIGDCGSITLFIEGVSMLCAKAIQDWPLYSGQEASTRYMDMSRAVFLGDEMVQGAWRSFYEKLMAELPATLALRFPKEDGQSESVYLKAIRARAFDIARGFLPAGCTTFLSWHTNLRQCADHLNGLLVHPMGEVRIVATAIQEQLQHRYPSSFRKEDRYAIYRAASEEAFAVEDRELCNGFSWVNNLDVEGISRYQNLLIARPAGAELHHRFRAFGSITFSFDIDYGSFRDVQRQRSCVQPMPLLTMRQFAPWYLDQLGDLRSEALTLLADQAARIMALGLTDLQAQYLTPMGYQVPMYLNCSLPSAIYIAELRASTVVHPTLRMIAQRMGDVLVSLGIPVHCDKTDTWSIKRGEQDIVRKDGI